MRTGWFVAGLAIVAGVSVAGTIVALGEVRALRAELARQGGTVAEQRRTQVEQERLLASLRRHRSPLTEEELAAWKDRIDRVTDESFGQILDLRMESSQIEAIVESLRADLQEVEDVESPAMRQRLEQEVRRQVAASLADQGLVLRRRRPTVGEVAGRLGLAPDQEEGMREIFSRARDRTLAMLQEPREDEMDLLAAFVDLENLSVYDPERDARYWKLLRLPSAGTTVHQRFLEIEDEADQAVARILTASQYEAYKALDVIPGELSVGAGASAQ